MTPVLVSRQINILLVSLFVLFYSIEAQGQGGIGPVDLRCESLENPIGIDNPKPGFSWKMADPRRGARQTACQILVASRPELLESDRGDLWDSGRVETDQNIHFVYGGKELTSRQRSFWKVRLWDENARPTPWSEAAKFTIGLLQRCDWSAEWIAASENDPKKRNCPLLRGTFDLTKIPADARLYVATPGYFLAYINGVKVGTDELMPSNAQFDRRVYYVTYDVAKLLKRGKNSITLWAGYGFYIKGYRGVEHDGPIIKGQLEMADADGKNRTTIATDASWKWSQSGLSATTPGIQGGYCHAGERVDLRKAIPGSGKPEPNDSEWKKCKVCEISPKILSAQPCEPNRIVQRVKPIAIERLDLESWIVDFGFNLTGSIEWTPSNLSDGQEVMIEYVDHRDRNHCPDRSFETFGQRDFVIAAGQKGGTFRSYFNYRAFRYVIFYGMKERPKLDDMVALRIRTNFDKTASFQCSNETLNRIHDMMELTLEGLSVGGNLVDCSHVERWGYGGDGHSSTEAACTLFNLQGFYANWHQAWRDAQRPDGDMPHAAPCLCDGQGGGPIWCGFLLTTSWYLYEQYGDPRVLEKNYEASKKWLGFVEKHCKDDILYPWPNPKDPYRAAWLGDWLVPKTDNDFETNGSLESRMLVNNCYRIYCYDIMAQTARALGYENEANQFSKTARRLRPIVHNRFYKPEKKSYAQDRQVDLHMALMVDLMPKELKPQIFETLEDNIVNRHKGHLCVGLVGTYFQAKQLIRDDRQDLLFLMHTQHDFPSYGFMLQNGATTTWEYWWGRRSRMHNCYNGPAIWFYRGLPGILPDLSQPGFRHFFVRPACLETLTHVRANYDSVQGRIVSNWHRLGNRLIFEIVVPANTTATVALPVEDSSKVTESGNPVGPEGKSPGVRFVGISRKGDDSLFECELQSGSYLFSVDASKSNARTKAYLKRHWPAAK
jgi:alpha-L-rhamnosidase